MKIIKKIIDFAQNAHERKYYRQIAQNYDFGGYKRIYNIHLRKTGGTSSNKIAISTATKDYDRFYKNGWEGYFLTSLIICLMSIC